MDWLEGLQGQIVGLDTAPLIYFIEESPVYLPIVQPLFEALERGTLRAATSVLTLLEVLVHPLRQRNPQLAEQYREILLNARGIMTLPLTPDIAESAARLRAEYTLRTPDAIQLATAVHAGAAAFLTGDARLPILPNLRRLLLDDLRGRTPPYN